MRDIFAGVAPGRIIAAMLAAFAAGAGFAAPAAAQSSNPPAMFIMPGIDPVKPKEPKKEPPPTEMPARLFQGCAGPDVPAAAPVGGRERIEETRGGSDQVTKQREFASLSLEDAKAQAGDKFNAACWFRVDGVWREEMTVSLDRSKDPKDWAADAPEILALANGNYTTPRFLVVLPAANYDETITVADGLADFAPVIYRAKNPGLSLKDVLKPGGPVKEYAASGASPFGQTLTINVPRSGRVRLIVGGKDFLRPKPNVWAEAARNNEDIHDVFLLERNIENLRATYQGYDIARQDGFYLLDSKKWEIFERSKKYVIEEKRTVPLGLTFLQDGSQGMVYHKTLISSEVGQQQTVAHNFGGNVGYDKPTPTGQSLTGASAGYDYAEKQMQSMKTRHSVSDAVGYSRYKAFAIVLDPPYAELSQNFIDAIEDARRFDKNGDWYRRIIDKFGTHYVYAVTYGASAKVIRSISEKEYQDEYSVDRSVNANISAKYMGAGGELRGGIQRIDFNSRSGTVNNEKTTFFAVGGNGSFDDGGFSAGGAPYPILLDLRPIHELLNPVNFPGEPEIYTTVRAKLKAAVEQYLTEYTSRPLSANSIVPPPPKQRWRISVSRISCASKVGFDKATVTVNLQAKSEKLGSATVRAVKNFESSCNGHDNTADERVNSPGITMEETWDKLSRAEVIVHTTFSYNFKGPTGQKRNKVFHLPNIAAGEAKLWSHTVSAGGKPNVKVFVLFEREK